MTATMKAIVQETYGSPDVLELREVAKPEPAAHEVRIKIHATTISATDAIFRAGNMFSARMYSGIFKPKFTRPGGEFAGEIEAIGAEVTRFQVGDQVIGTTGPNFGAHAEFICLPEEGVLGTKPANMTYAEAIGFHPGGMTAWPFIHEAANLQAGQKILINGASGSIGTIAVQLAKYLGAEVIGVCSTANLELVKSLGADEVIDYTQEDFTQNLDSYDVIFDAVGKSNYWKCKRALKAGGIYLTTSLAPANLWGILWTSKFGTKKAKIEFAGLRSSTDKNNYMKLFLELVEKGQLKPVVDRVYPLSQISEAHRYVETGHKKGTVVVAIP